MKVSSGVPLKFVLLLVLWVQAEARASEPLPMLVDRVDQLEQLRHARDLMIVFRFQRAENQLVGLARDGAEAPAMYHLSIISLVKGLMTDEEQEFTDFFARSDELTELLRQESPSRWRDLLQAENELNRAVAHAKMGNSIRAALSGRSAYGSFEALARDYPEFPEVYKGLGILKLSIGTLSGGYRRVLKLLGFRGSVEEGLDLLLRAYHESEFGRDEAGIFLALLIAQVERSSDEPVRLLRELHQERPDSPLMAFLYGYMLLHHRHAKKAETVLAPLIRETGHRDIEYARFYLAQAMLLQDRYEEAAHHFRSYLQEHKGESLRAQAVLGLALALELNGNRSEALKWYRRVDDSRGHENDLAAGREAAHRIAHPIEGEQRTLLLARHAFDSGRYERTQNLLLSLLEGAALDAAERAEAAYRLGRSYHADNQYAEALKWYLQATADADKVEGRWAPWSHFYRGEILEAQGDIEGAKAEYMRATDFKHEYDYSISLHSSVRASLEMMQ